MKQSNKQFAIALYQATKDLSDNDLTQVVKNFVLLLAKKHKLTQSNIIISEFVQYTKKQKGIMDIEITTAREIDKKTTETIKKIFGEQTESISKTDNKLLGGLIIKTEEVIFDASLKTQLTKLQQTFQ